MNWGTGLSVFCPLSTSRCFGTMTVKLALRKTLFVSVLLLSLSVSLTLWFLITYSSHLKFAILRRQIFGPRINNRCLLHGYRNSLGNNVTFYERNSLLTSLDVRLRSFVFETLATFLWFRNATSNLKRPFRFDIFKSPLTRWCVIILST